MPDLAVPRPLRSEVALVDEDESRRNAGQCGIEYQGICSPGRYRRQRADIERQRRGCVERRRRGRDVCVIEAQFSPDRDLDGGCERLGAHETLLSEIESVISRNQRWAITQLPKRGGPQALSSPPAPKGSERSEEA